MFNSTGLPGSTLECYRHGLTFYEWFWGQTAEPCESECWEWQGLRFPQGYGRVYHPDDGWSYTHRIAWRLSRGRDIQAGLSILHHCDNPPCVRPTHLYEGTQADNADDRDHYRGKSVAARRRIRTRQRHSTQQKQNGRRSAETLAAS